MDVRSLVSSIRALVWVSVQGTMGDTGVGFLGVLTISCWLFMIMLVKEPGGYQVTVSQICSILVSQIHMVWHQ
jgi:hypothetical protein